MLPLNPQTPNAIASKSDGLFTFGEQKQRLATKEVAVALGIGDKQVYALVESGWLLASPINDAEKTKRESKRIERFSVVAFWRERSLEANGIELPFAQTAQVIWWRNELRKRKGLKPL